MYEQIVSNLSDGSVPIKQGWNNINPSKTVRWPDDITRITALKSGDVVILVEFYVFSSSLAHTGYAYINTANSTQATTTEQNLRFKRITGQWYGFSD